MISIFIAEDHTIVRHGLAQMIAAERDLSVAGQAGTADELLNDPALTTCDVVLLDVTLGQDNGLVLIEPIRVRNPRAAILILSMHPEEHFAVRVLRMGGAGYVQKSVEPAELLRVIRLVARGGRYLSPAMAEKVATQPFHDAAVAPHERLSPREFEVFLLLTSGLSVSGIAERLGVTVNTVSTHRQRILLKMEMTSNAALVHYAVQNGLVS
ncbi:MAG TPA: response regulator transcription factor [Thermoanaerobaculia bacterium]|nr:response regulator transcription factor [Thermoanaerobaculia bacterium]